LHHGSSGGLPVARWQPAWPYLLQPCHLVLCICQLLAELLQLLLLLITLGSLLLQGSLKLG
jgi:hypothetical protein